ncbi:MAG: hypothetical protein KA165_14255 [Saprospiraceae bacterium]|nr:hypothetical protein [Saprospiraceae bacterium]
MTESEKIHALIESLKGDVNYLIAKAWNNEDFFTLCSLFLTAICEDQIKNNPGLKIELLQPHILNQMETLITDQAESIRSELRRQDQVTKTFGNRVIYFQLT